MKKKNNIRFIALLGLLAALIVLFWYGIGTINLGFIKITLSCLPVIVGTIALGMKSGMILAFCFATISFFTSLTQPQGLLLPIFGASAFWGALQCYVPRLLVPLITETVLKVMKNKNAKVSMGVAAGAGSLTNTIFFLGGILLLYQLIGIENPELLGLVGTTVLAGGLPEAAVNVLVCPAVILALKKARLIPQE